ncbi:acyltransferase [Chitinophaga ginsengisoli]|uniref:Surface polysaccharide O-acyltransferase-like enzyme n=1 Tax=Chitinophaga ginsengisoli TaxID=363837 RepID=A0A2P8GM29_9BACT|nr:acyltransferase [Chitinophaga ginsengisoli]PSL35028.1 surface polysaccharide O-acyltransferase-like enzyme [Chitinophaga ginsengisoli]
MIKNVQRDTWVDYLRATITVLVVAHHSSLAYTTFAHFDKEAYINSTHPIVDNKRWIGLDIFENFNDIFFMSLMFFIGGLFLTKSIAKKGMMAFIRDRCLRLFIPFIFIGTLSNLIAHFPSFYIAHNDGHLKAYITDFFTVEKWPVGPPWFIWVLFAFNLLFALIYMPAKHIFSRTGNLINHLDNRPVLCFLLLAVLTWILYVPVAYHIGAGMWTGWGPFDFQLSRILLYFGYFLTGAIVGNADFHNGIFARDSILVSRWRIWIILALAVYLILTVSGQYEVLKHLVIKGALPEFTAWMIYYTVYVLSCTLSCIAFLTTFRALANRSKRWIDSLADNAYLIYLIHYIFVLWTQLFLLDLATPAWGKFLIVFLNALALSWMISLLLRRFHVVKKYL